MHTASPVNVVKGRIDQKLDGESELFHKGL